ncbi:MAG TPA: serine hydrolase [Steroidobacteraceae bacterium]|nr:serine hydrolase [Steroidobacteraceae bacterium]
MRLSALGAVLLATAAAAAAPPAPPAPPAGAAGAPVTRAGALRRADLEGAATPAGPWAMTAFAPPAGARAPSHVFEGRLVLAAQLPGGAFRVLKDLWHDADANQGAARQLPPFDFAFVQSGPALIPLERGAVRSAHTEWEFVLEPGRVWDQDGDRGLTRAALPFALEERNANCMHNGVLTFLFGDAGRVSNVAWEIGQETCFYFKFDAWGASRARYLAGAVRAKADLIARYRRELAGRVPSRPIAQLASDHPGADPGEFGSPLEIPAADMTLYGAAVDGVHYTSGCATRFGPYPYCDELDLPSYSLAKTLVAGLATMRAAQLDPTVLTATIASLVPECAGHGWDDVTVAATLDMATGHYESTAREHDENGDDMEPFFAAEDHASRIRFACSHYPRKAPAGTIWVYHTADSYLLGTALAAWDRRRAGPAADFFHDLLIEPIWHPLGLSPAVDVTRRVRDASAQPFTGYGLTLKRDDVVKLAQFMMQGGRIGNEQVIDAAMLRAALQQDPAHPGLTAASPEVRYHDGVWAWNAAAYLGCTQPAWIPFMSGYGGIQVVMFPNGIVYYYFSDGGVWAFARAAREADRIRPFCRRD